MELNVTDKTTCVKIPAKSFADYQTWKAPRPSNELITQVFTVIFQYL